MSKSSAESSFVAIDVAVITVTDTRTYETDSSGKLVVDLLTAAGHNVVERELVADEKRAIQDTLSRVLGRRQVDVVVMTGGTGLTPRDVTPEAVAPFVTKPIPGFGELFRWLSYQTIGTSTVQSRACAAVARGTYVFALPGSNGAVKDGWDGILAEQLDSRNRPCNFVELMPRLRET
jgi:molybdopterin adenylyltransferase